MAKKRVHELAKDFNVESKKIIQTLESLGVAVKSHMSTVDDKDVDKLRSIYQNKGGMRTQPPVENKKVEGDLQKTANFRQDVRQDNRHDTRGGSQAHTAGLVDRVPQRPPDKRFVERPRQDNKHNTIGRAQGNKTNQGSRTNQGNRPNQGNRTNQSSRPNQGNRANQGNRPNQGRPNQSNRSNQGTRYSQGGRPEERNTQNKTVGGMPRGGQGVKGPGGRQQGGYKGKGPDRGTPVKMPKPDQAALIDSRNKAEEKAKSMERQKAQEKFANKERQWGKNKFNERKIDFPKKGQKRKPQGKSQEKNVSTIHQKKPINIPEVITVQEFAAKIGKTAAEVIKKLMQLGIMATINQDIDADTVQILAAEFGFEVNIKPEENEETMLQAIEVEDAEEDLEPRPCVVTVMGHVDHGKTSLLDAIRETNVTSTEAGGITQHIGAYQVEVNGKKITFVDTPGHEAFTAMRARGAQVTDIAILVVAADDGVMPQTVEAINHAKAANVPIIVAINKIDKDNATPDRVKQELTEHELVVEEWGGDTISVNISALKKEGINELLEMVLLVAEMAELKANPNRPAKGTVIEAELDKGRGPVATVLVQNGTLHVGDTIVSGSVFGKVRAMMNDRGRRVEKAGPSQPVEVLGFHDVPQAGDIFQAVDDEKLARYVASKRQTKKREEELKITPKVSLDDLFKHIQEGNIKELPLIIKADVQGSVEALRQSLERLSTDEVKVKLIHGGVGAVTETDVMLASTTNAIIIGFNVRPDTNAIKAAEAEQVDVRLYRVIYDAIDDVKAAMSGLLDPEFKEVVLGRAEVRQIFKVSKVGTIAGCYVTEGKITRDAGVRVIRDGIVIHEGKLDSLKRFKDDAKEVVQGYECGIMLEKFNDIKEQDFIEAFTIEAVKRELA
ncbi:translation initiation factor IF-2 [Desulfolucanica intricata]|uniref:translation initiation factor IF-2 n=1 Tax=Desulfolucanica intricata TaxID=1285191 RepID=UPI00082E88C7|nr:translation initiation factor IF-2 [Desulfolucanica intricata]